MSDSSTHLYSPGLVGIIATESSVSNINGSTSTVFRLTVQPDSKDIKSVRNQVLEFNLNDATVNVSVDNFAETAGVGYTTTSSNY